MKKAEVIGSKVIVDLPETGSLGIPAKVDTGADSSSIWASDISEENGVLTFTLLSAKAPGYTGKQIVTSDYTQSRVRNSFGHTEVRYKVAMLAVIQGVKVRAKFTLANRERNRYPVLIGRRTLSGHFIVDVSSKETSEEPRKLLILSQRITKNVADFSKKVEEYGENVLVQHTDYADLTVRFIDGQMSVTLRSTGEDLSAYDMVHFKTSETRDITAALAYYCSSNGTKILDPIVQSFPTTSKLYQYAILSSGAVRIPDSVFLTRKTLAEDGSYDSIAHDLGTPFVLKGIHVSKGEHNYLIKSKKDFANALHNADSEEIYLIAQKFIPNKSDYRILVFGQKIELVIERTGESKDSHLNNTSKGGSATLHSVDHLPREVCHDSLRAAALMGRDVAGVDMMQGSDDGVWYCLEVNDGPQIATGAFVEEKQRAFAKFITRKLG